MQLKELGRQCDQHPMLGMQVQWTVAPA